MPSSPWSSWMECFNPDKSWTGAYQPLGAVSRLFKILKAQRPRAPLGALPGPVWAIRCAQVHGYSVKVRCFSGCLF